MSITQVLPCRVIKCKSMRLKSLQWYDAKDKRKKRKADLPDMSLIVILQFLTVTLSVKKKKKTFQETTDSLTCFRQTSMSASPVFVLKGRSLPLN